MTKARLHWEFYKSTLTINLGFAFAISVVIFPAFFTVFPIIFMSFGPIVSLSFKEILRKNEYYFYYNKGISKIALITSSFGLSILIGSVLLILLPYVESFGN